MRSWLTSRRKRLLIGAEHFNKRDYRKAIEAFTDVIKSDFLSPEAFASRGAAYLEIGAYSEAVADYSYALILAPGNPAYFTARGLAFARSGQHHQAIKDFAEALRLSPDDIVSYIGRARSYEAVGQHDLAIDDNTKVIGLDPSAAAAFCSRGQLYAKHGDLAKAAADLHQAHKLAPDSTWIKDVFAQVLVQRKRLSPV